MAKQTIQVADKPTLDAVKTLLEDNGYGLEVLKELLTSIDEKVSGSGSGSGSVEVTRVYHTESISGNGGYSTLLNHRGKGVIKFLTELVVANLIVDDNEVNSNFFKKLRDNIGYDYYEIPYNKSIEFKIKNNSSSSSKVYVTFEIERTDIS